MTVALEAGFSQGAQRHPSVVPRVPPVQGLQEGYPCARNVGLSACRGFHTPKLPKLTGGAGSSTHREQACRLGHRGCPGPGCCTSAEIVFAPMGGGP